MGICFKENNMASRTEDVINYILHEIHTGSWPVQSCIPSQMSLTKKLNCSRTTVERAIAKLVAAEVLTSKRGSGTFVCQKKTGGISEIIIVAASIDQQQRSSFMEMFMGLDTSGLPTYWYNFEQAFNNICELKQRKAAVISYMPDSPQLLFLNSLRDLGVPVLVINRTYGNFDYVSTDTEASLREGISWLFGKTGRNAETALVTFQPDQLRPYLAERVIACYEIIMELGMNMPPELMIRQEFSDKSSYERIADIFSRKSSCLLALITPNDELASVCLKIAGQHKKVCGKDFFLLTYDGIYSGQPPSGVGILSQNFQQFQLHIEQWIRQQLSGNKDRFTAKVKTRLRTF